MFIKEMKFLFYLLTELYDSILPKFKMICPIFSHQLAEFLVNFNQNSMISNEMTSMLLQEELKTLIPEEFSNRYQK